MSNLAVNTLRTLITLIEDKQARKIFKDEIAHLEKAEEQVNKRIEELEVKQKVFNDSHKSVSLIEEAEAYNAEATKKLENARYASKEMLEKAEEKVNNLKEEINIWQSDIETREKHINRREAEYNKNINISKNEQTNQKTTLAKREEAVYKREQETAKFKTEYEDKLRALEKSLLSLRGQ